MRHQGVAKDNTRRIGLDGNAVETVAHIRAEEMHQQHDQHGYDADQEACREIKNGGELDINFL